ncbi:LOW QUALITY PROTEIN: gag_pre-integrs domain-containing protein, partial [Cephalotus follicularis]
SCEDGVLKISKGAILFMKGLKVGSLYKLQGSTVIGSVTVSSSVSDSDGTKLWHMRLGRISERGMHNLSKRGLLGVTTKKLDFCEHCIYGKYKRVSFSTTIHKTKGILDYIYSDLWSPSSVP